MAESLELLATAGAIVRAGTTITFHVEGAVYGFPAPNVYDVQSRVIDALGQWFTVYTVKVVDAPGTWTGLFNPNYVATVVAAPRMDYGAIADLKAVIREVFRQHAGDVPTVAAPVVGGVATGEPAIPNAPTAGSDGTGGPHWETALMWVAVAAVAGGAVYVTSKVT